MLNYTIEWIPVHKAMTDWATYLHSQSEMMKSYVLANPPIETALQTTRSWVESGVLQNIPAYQYELMMNPQKLFEESQQVAELYQVTYERMLETREKSVDDAKNCLEKAVEIAQTTEPSPIDLARLLENQLELVQTVSEAQKDYLSAMNNLQSGLAQLMFRNLSSV